MESQMIQNLQALKILLTEETWTRRALFRLYGKERSLRCCLHGGAQIVCNKEISDLLSHPSIMNIEEAFDLLPYWSDAMWAGYTWFDNQKLDKKAFWDARTCSPKYDINFLLGMVGAYALFNDNAMTTLEMVHAKIDQAIEVAKLIGI